MKLPKGHAYKLSWYDPVAGGALRLGSVDKIEGADRLEVGLPPNPSGRDQVLLIQRN